MLGRDVGEQIPSPGRQIAAGRKTGFVKPTTRLPISLSLPDQDLRRPSVQLLAGSPHLARLTRLDLSGNRIYVKDKTAVTLWAIE